MRNLKTPILVLLLVVWLPVDGSCEGREYLFQGQLSGWTRGYQSQGDWHHYSGIRYLPEFSVEQDMGESSHLGIQAALNGVWAAGSGDDDEIAEVELYRAAGWYATPRTETIIGLQKITFGPSRLLRPLQWFDRIDPADPMGLTRGVYALRFRYFASNNANVWLWCLYPNEENDVVGRWRTSENTLEWGGRFQAPVVGGDMAVSLHLRRVDAAQYSLPDYDERRIGLDGRWDLVVGFWFEAVIQHQASAFLPYEWVKMLGLGMDYTFEWGNGVYALIEHMGTGISEETWGWDEEQWYTAIMLNYPFNVIDTFQFIGFYDWTTSDASGFLEWRRVYDRFIVSFGLFSYPNESNGWNDINNSSRRQSFSGSGAALTLIFNH